MLLIQAIFNNKLKELRKDHSVVPIKQLISVIQEQFQGEQGEKFQNACATFCQNQQEAMKLLQSKMKHATDKFSLFLNVNILTNIKLKKISIYVFLKKLIISISCFDYHSFIDNEKNRLNRL